MKPSKYLFVAVSLQFVSGASAHCVRSSSKGVPKQYKPKVFKLARISHKIAIWAHAKNEHEQVCVYKRCVDGVIKVLNNEQVSQEEWSSSCKVYLEDITKYDDDRDSSRATQRDIKAALDFLPEIQRKLIAETARVNET